jgi:two-component system CheB/CheR fusion protein
MPRIVGIGASAGGIEAFHSFFENMPGNSGMAFVVLLHLPVARKSMLPDILARWTTMPVIDAEDGTEIEPNHVYVPRPHATVTLEGNRLRAVVPPQETPREHRPIDVFFDSLAVQLRSNAIGIVMSGTGSDGSLGLKAIKEHGGLTMAQGTDGSAPLFDGMPAGAIATGAVDLVSVVEDMPGHLLRLVQQDGGDADAGEEELPADATDQARLRICAILRAQLDHDFSSYKEKTFLRRVARRMQVRSVAGIGNYVSLLEQDRDEVTMLFRDLLIRVTSFFRDKETFEILEREVIPSLFEGRPPDSAVRVWVPGCATGEEAYSLAILLREHMDKLRVRLKVQLFATDIDEPAIAIARLGRYPATLLEGMPVARRARFFRPSANGYAVTKEIRDLCTFSPHSLVRDPPFSRIDMISCRNLLIYMDSSLQARVVPAFHYSLVPGGILLLGSSETTSRHDDLFEPLDKASRIFRRRDVPTAPIDLPYAKGLGRTTAPPQLPPSERGDPGSAPNELSRGLNGYADAGESNAQDSGDGLMGQAGAAFRRRVASLVRRLSPEDGDTDRLLLELRSTQEQLHAITEEHETALEELRSANEELHSVNEELQSTNEEMETSREEIQSVNEELHTVNLQLSEKVDELDRANSDLRNLFASTQIATIFLDRDLRIRSFTPAATSIYSLIPSDQGRKLTDFVSQVEHPTLQQDVASVLDSLQPLERRVKLRSDGTHFIMRILPYRSTGEDVSGTLVTYMDVTSVVRAEQHQRLLVDELNHRVKNMLTVVVSLASQTLRRSRSLDEFSGSFMGRVHALTASYTLLSNEKWLSVSLRDIAREELRPYAAQDGSNITFAGPNIQLTPSAALGVGMAIHELAANAMKFGALCAPEGRVRIDWAIEAGTEAEDLVIHWRETGGPQVHEPQTRGFGSTLIERGFAHELSGRADIMFETQGVHAILRAPIERAVARSPLSGSDGRS